MKKNLSFLLILLVNSFSYAQENEMQKKEKYDLYLSVGTKTVLIDFISGASIGLSLHNPEKPFSFNLRNDYVIPEKESTYLDTNNQLVTLNNYEGIRFMTQTNLEVEYKLKLKKATNFYISGGFTWNNSGERANRLSSDYGYSGVSLAFKYKVSWLILDIKGDLPLKYKSFRTFQEFNVPAPITFGMTYRFKPRKHE